MKAGRRSTASCCRAVPARHGGAPRGKHLSERNRKAPRVRGEDQQAARGRRGCCDDGEVRPEAREGTDHPRTIRGHRAWTCSSWARRCPTPDHPSSRPTRPTSRPRNSRTCSAARRAGASKATSARVKSNFHRSYNKVAGLLMDGKLDWLAEGSINPIPPKYRDWRRTIYEQPGHGRRPACRCGRPGKRRGRSGAPALSSAARRDRRSCAPWPHPRRRCRRGCAVCGSRPRRAAPHRCRVRTGWRGSARCSPWPFCTSVAAADASNRRTTGACPPAAASISGVSSLLGTGGEIRTGANQAIDDIA